MLDDQEAIAFGLLVLAGVSVPLVVIIAIAWRELRRS